MNDQKSTSQGRLKLLLGLLATACAAVFVIAILPGLLKPEEIQARVLTPPACDISTQRCALEDQGIRLAFALTPTPVTSATPLNAQLEIEGLAARNVVLSLEGREMYMGINQTTLRPANTDSSTWEGETELAVCTTGRMVWRAMLLIETDTNVYKTWFDFEAN